MATEIAPDSQQLADPVLRRGDHLHVEAMEAVQVSGSLAGLGQADLVLAGEQVTRVLLERHHLPPQAGKASAMSCPAFAL